MSDKINATILLLGDSMVGKTKIRHRLENIPFEKVKLQTIGSDFTVVNLEYENQDLSLAIWDIAGAKQFEKTVKRFYKKANGAVFVFDLTRRSSILDLMYWNHGFETSPDKDFPVILLGNKSDLVNRREVNNEDIEVVKVKLEDYFNNKISYFETSAKNNSGIIEAFENLAGKLIKKFNYLKN